MSNFTINKEIQYDEYIELNDLKPEVSKKGIFFPISVNYVDVNQFGGDGRSFGYQQDNGYCTVATYEPVFGTLAEDTIELFANCLALKKSMEKPSHSMLDVVSSENCDTSKAKLLIRYGSEYFYKDEKGYFFITEHYCHGKPQRITNSSAEMYQEVNTTYQQDIKKYNEMMKEALENMELLKETI